MLFKVIQRKGVSSDCGRAQTFKGGLSKLWEAVTLQGNNSSVPMVGPQSGIEDKKRTTD